MPEPGARSLAEDLRQRSDEELAALLQARPDLARPAPTDVTALAARSTTRASIHRALDALDLAHLQALEALLVSAPASENDVAELLGIDSGQAQELLTDLRDLALCWLAPEGMRTPRPVADVVGQPGGLGPASAQVPTGDALDAALQGLQERQRNLLAALTWGPARGAVASAPTDGSPASPMVTAAQELLEAGLLIREDEEHVVLPRQVALTLRQGRLHRHSGVQPPAAELTELDLEVVDAAAGGRAADLVVLLTEVIDEWGSHPPRVLRSGGLAARDLTRLAAHLESDVAQVCWLLESAHAAGLLAIDDGGQRSDAQALWAPTTTADTWMEEEVGTRWATLASAWWSMSAAPSLVGSSESGRVNVLSTQTSYPPGRQRRHDVLRALATLPTGAAPGADDLADLLRWRHPLRSARAREEHGVGLETVLREAEWAGLTGRGALSTPGRSIVLAQEGAGAEMDPLVPPAVDHVLLQADLTAIAPGRLDGPARALMRLTSDVESRGGATVHRFSEVSVRRALDLGWTADRLLDELAQASRTGVPQPLDYLVRDVARRHGLARVGACASYLRCDDAALLDRIERDRALGMVQWRRIAPTVLVSPVPAGTVLDLLREEQYGPVTDGVDGGLELVGASQRRAPRPSSPAVRVSGVDAVVSAQVVAIMRRGDGGRVSAGAYEGSSDPVVVAAAVREAAADSSALWIGYADDAGGVATHLLRPLAVEGGRVRATVGDADVARTFLLHRITRVRPAD